MVYFADNNIVGATELFKRAFDVTSPCNEQMDRVFIYIDWEVEIMCRNLG